MQNLRKLNVHIIKQESYKERWSIFPKKSPFKQSIHFTVIFASQYKT